MRECLHFRRARAAKYSIYNNIQKSLVDKYDDILGFFGIRLWRLAFLSYGMNHLPIKRLVVQRSCFVVMFERLRITPPPPQTKILGTDKLLHS